MRDSSRQAKERSLENTEGYTFIIKEKVDVERTTFFPHFWVNVKAYIISFSFDPILSNGDLHQFSSVTQSCPTLCDPMSRSTTGLPVHYQLPEFTQTHVHRVSDAILSSPSPAANPSQHQSLFQ